MDIEENSGLIALTADIVSAHVSHNNVAPDDLPNLIASVHAALAKAGQPAVPEAPKAEPTVPVRSSIKHDYIVCLEDGKKLKMLKRYLRTNYKMTPEDYRAKWRLPRDYPMVAPAYAETRRGLAQKSGLGRKKPVEAAVPLMVTKLVAKVAKPAKTSTPKIAKPATAAPPKADKVAEAPVPKPAKLATPKPAKAAAMVAAPIAAKVAKIKAVTTQAPAKVRSKLKIAGPKA